MKASKAVYDAIRESKIDFVVGVPCANLKNLINLINDNKNNSQITYIPATREEEAIGICAGAHLAGRKTCLLMQNSGLGNSINAIGSLCKVYQIPMLIIISHRGELKEKIPAQIPMGRWTKNLLETAEIPYYCPKTPEEAYKIIIHASEYSETMGYPVAILLDALYWEHDIYNNLSP
ncbi:sulfopyruvate decarboxylase subunit alpha [Methanothermococcus sp.]|uniref:sulfopyruvate decarboxylase subunit alpha n=1 Tax=Methanothermococcus sp. TaxID=2614238 RepID=UPI0025CEA6CB|nr:sulfopyruvate decarboxylase subunit alpha [Methanothermococcus sp.]